MPELDQRIINTIEDNDWTVTEITKQDGEYYVELGTYSDCGEDFWITIWFDGTNKGFTKGVADAYEDFDPEEHVAMWYNAKEGSGAPSSLRILLDDADGISDSLETLAIDLAQIKFD